MKRIATSAAVCVAVSILCTAGYAQAPQASAPPAQRTLASDWQALQNALMHVSQDLEIYMQESQKSLDSLSAQLRDAEAQKHTLIEWLTQAQDETKK